jgi:signal transduction histidine kinase
MASAAVRSGRRRGQDAYAARLARTLAYVGSAIVALSIALAVTLDSSTRSQVGPDLIVWALLSSVGAISTLELGEGRPALSMDLPVLLACSFSEGPVAAGLVAFAGTFDQFEIRGQSNLTHVLSNHAQTALSVMAAGFVFASVGGLSNGIAVAVVAALLALLADVVVNYSCVALLQAFISGRRPIEVLSAMKVGAAGPFAASYAAFGLLGLLVTVAFLAFGFGGVVVCIAPLILARAAFSQSFHAEQAHSRVRAQATALSRVDERIADERHDERSKIAAALHDDVLQCIYNVEIRAQVIREDLRSGRLLELEGDVPALVEAAEAAADELREVIGGLRRSPIGRTGLTDTVSLLANHLRDETGINFVLALQPVSGVSADVELLAYQVLREAMTNAAQHSHGDTVWVSLKRDADKLVLEVIDNGVGFDPETVRVDKHFGLTLMHERAETAGGSIEIRSKQGQGAVVVVRIALR